MRSDVTKLELVYKDTRYRNGGYRNWLKVRFCYKLSVVYETTDNLFWYKLTNNELIKKNVYNSQTRWIYGWFGL
jgi:hypothetical protein